MPPKKQVISSNNSYITSPKGDLKFFLNNTSYIRSPPGVVSQSHSHLSNLLTSEETSEDPQKAEKQQHNKNAVSGSRKQQQLGSRTLEETYANRRDNFNLERPNEKLLRSQLLSINTEKINIKELMMQAAGTGPQSSSTSATTSNNNNNNNRLSFGASVPFFPDIHQKLAATMSTQHLRNRTDMESLEQISITENNNNANAIYNKNQIAAGSHGDSLSTSNIPQGPIGGNSTFNSIFPSKTLTPTRWINNENEQNNHTAESFAKVGKEILSNIDFDNVQRGSSEHLNRTGFSRTMNGFSRELKHIQSRESRKDGNLTDSARLGYDVSHLLDPKRNKLRKFEISLSLLERVVTSSK